MLRKQNKETENVLFNWLLFFVLARGGIQAHGAADLRVLRAEQLLPESQAIREVSELATAVGGGADTRDSTVRAVQHFCQMPPGRSNFCAPCSAASQR